MSVREMTALQLQEALAGNSVVLIDVREPTEYESAHISGAKLIPLGQLLPSDLPNGPIVFQCRSGGRSHAACELILKSNPNATVYNLVGGIVAWIEAGYGVVKG